MLRMHAKEKSLENKVELMYAIIDVKLMYVYNSNHKLKKIIG